MGKENFGLCDNRITKEDSLPLTLRGNADQVPILHTDFVHYFSHTGIPTLRTDIVDNFSHRWALTLTTDFVDHLSDGWSLT